MLSLALGPTQILLKWVMVVMYIGKCLTGNEADHSPPSDTEVKKEWSYTYTSPIYLNGMIFLPYHYISQ
jgi:hypothetical protein